MSGTNSYESPFCTRYASKEMQFIFSADKKFTTWRKLWVALARAEMKLGLPVTEEQVKELEQILITLIIQLPLNVKSRYAMTLWRVYLLAARTQRELFTSAQLLLCRRQYRYNYNA